MARLDAEERIARKPVETRRLTPPEIVDYTRSLPRLWADAGPDGRQAMVVAIFAKLDVLGFQRLEFDLTADAVDLGLDATLPPVIELQARSVSLVGARGVAPTLSNLSSGSTRGTPLRFGWSSPRRDGPPQASGRRATPRPTFAHGRQRSLTWRDPSERGHWRAIPTRT
jgi:hypothetical protein